MNALAVQNPPHKCDLGNKNDSATDNKITTDIFDCNNNYYNYYTEIILYLCVCITSYTPSLTSLTLEMQCKNQDLENRFVATIMWIWIK